MEVEKKWTEEKKRRHQKLKEGKRKEEGGN